MDDEVEVQSAAEDVLAEISRVVRLAHGLVQSAQHGDDLTAQIDERVLRADGVAGDDDALDEGMRVGEEERDVLAGPGLRFIGVDHEVVGFAVALGDELPLHARGEACAAPAAQAGFLDVGDEFVR